MRGYLPVVVLACSSLCGCASTGGPAPGRPAPADLVGLEARARLDTLHIEPQLRLVTAYRDQGRLRDALPVAERALARWPDNAWAALLVGVTREDLGDYPLARDYYERALRTTKSARLRSELRQRLVLLQRRETQAAVKAALAREAELASTPPRPRTVAVFPLAVAAPDSIMAPLGRALTAMLITDLARTDRLTVLDRTLVQMLAEEIRLAEQGLVDERTAARGGRLLGAERIVQGSLAAQEERLRLEAAVVSLALAAPPAAALAKPTEPPRAGKPAAPAKKPAPARTPVPTRQAPPKPAAPAPPTAEMEKAAPPPVRRTERLAETDRLEGLFDMEKRLALKIYAAAGVELTPAERAQVTARRTENLQAVLAYGRGLLSSDAGDYGAALRHFNQAARLDPGFATARAQASATRSLAAASRVSTQQLAATAEQAAAGAQAAMTAITPVFSLGRDALAELLGTEGETATTAIELIIRRPGGAQ